MNKPQQSPCCSPQDISSFLNDELAADQREELSVHIESCNRCQEALANEAAHPEFWNEAAGLLNVTDTWNALRSDETDESEEPRAPFSTQSLLDWLSPTDDPRMLGRVGEYEINAIVGTGGMGAVFKGFDKSLLRVVAIKVMAPHLANHGSARTRFEREARAAAAVSHDNVVAIYRVDEMDGLPYLVMPFARGPSLQRRIDQGGPLSTLDVVQVGRQIAAGLAAAHEQGLVHRDIKPANILLNDGIERLLLTDFGVARAMDDASMTQTGLIAGTPQYMSPEQARGEAVDYRSDLFSLGAVLYTACTGRPPFRADAPFAVLRKITEMTPRPIRELNPDVPDWLEAIILRLLDKDPNARFQSAEAVAELFERCLAHLRQPTLVKLPEQALDTLAIAATPKPTAIQPTRNRIRLTGITMSFLAILALAVVGFFQFTDAPEIAGRWNGENWADIQLKSVEQAKDWYAGQFVNAEGQQGAIHLEWSPLRRRFDGRWSVGEEQSGTIVLRSNPGGGVRGAILMDTDSKTMPNQTRLRDFVWQRSDNNASSATGLTGNTTPQSQSLPKISRRTLAEIRNQQLRNREILAAMTAPQSGVIKLLAAGLRNGKVIRKGEFLMEIENNDSGKHDAQIASLRQRLTTAETKVAAYEANAKGFQDARDYSVQAAEEMANAAESKYQSKKNLIAGMKAKALQAKQNYERAKQLSDSGVVPVSEVDQAKTEWDVAIADLSAAEQEAKNLENEWKARKLEVEAKRNQAQTKIDYALAMKEDAEKEIVAITKEVRAVQIEADQAERITIMSPVDGIVGDWKGLYQGQTIEKGDPIVTLLAPTPPGQSTSLDLLTPGAPNTTTRSDVTFGLNSVPGMLRLGSDLAEKLQAARDELNRLQPIADNYNAVIADRSASIAKLQAELNDPFAADRKPDEELNRDIKLRQNKLDVLKSEQTTHQEALNRAQMELFSVKAELDTMTQLIALELDSVEKEIKDKEELLNIKKAQYKMGEIPYLEVQPTETELRKLKTRAQQVMALLSHFQKIEPAKKAEK